ncbi:MAG: pantoate--beta-alanine ligase [Thermodesulfobacteriota bacterium]
MEIIRTPAEMTAWANRASAAGQSIGFVPTMGFLHEGHLALMRMARGMADCLVVSLFVNPIQFGPAEDLSRYPRDFEGDCAKAAAAGADVLFAPAPEDMYPPEARTRVVVSGVSEGLCGASRPGHFDGVATVVAKLFHLVKPRVAVFGQKDLQQLAVIRRMVADLNWDISIVGHPIVREPDGLAMSSRNSYLTDEERQTALCLHKAIRHARGRVREGLTSSESLTVELVALLSSHLGVEIDYVSLVDGESLRPVKELRPGVVLALAVRVGKTRLIDNDVLFADDGQAFAMQGGRD